MNSTSGAGAGSNAFPVPRRRAALKRLAARVLLLGLALVGWGLLGSDRVPSGLVAVAHASDADVERYLDRLARKEKEKPEHELTALRIFNRVVLLIKDNYVDPKRIDPKAMMVAALDHVEKTVPEVMIEGDAKGGKLKVTVGGASRDVDISAVDTPWRMSFALKEVFDFFDSHLITRDDTRDIEYAAVNGMLSTLDPHSVLLKPDMYKEMKLQTKGEFGGLGFVISMKEGQLTVVKVLKNTPASRAGIKAKDQITKIEEESTVNMDLNEAVSRLRGKPDSRVSITVARSSWTEPKRLTLTRAVIQIESVDPVKLLAGNVGYVRVKNFQANTGRDLTSALRRLRQEAGGTLKGLVLDLRSNPGGLLEQAIQVSDMFLPSGTIVTTVGYSDRLREVKKAHAEDTESELPLVVMVNRGSASASEIVAGAVKNLNRGVVLGSQTFGKGSVQVLYDFPDESALKLTIAQYLTPGDVSIQEVGITPDIALVRTQVTKDRVDLFAPKKFTGEANLDKHFQRPVADSAEKKPEAAPREKPIEEVRFLKEKDPRKKDDRTDGASPAPEEDPEDADAEDSDEFFEDFEIRFARDLITAAPANTRQKMLTGAGPFIADRRKQEEERISKAIELLGVNWAAAEGAVAAGKPANLVAEMRPGAAVKTPAGETLQMTITVENKGDTPLGRLWAYTESDDPYLDRREFLFGALAPGERRTWAQPVKLPKDLASRRDVVTVKFRDGANTAFDDLKADLTFVELPHPSFAYTWQVVDTCPDVCNGDGLVQRGEEIGLVLEVKNVGAGKAIDAVASLKNMADDKVFIKKGRAKLGEIPPGQSRQASFVLEVKKGLKGETFPVKIAMGDDQLDEYLAQKVDVPLVDTGARSLPKKTVVRTKAPAAILAAATKASRTLATVAKNVTLQTQAQLGDWYRVEFAKGRTGFVAVDAVRDAKRLVPPKDKEIAPAEGRLPPRIELAADGSQGPVVTESERFTLTGTASDPQNLRNVYVFVNDQKVFFHTSKPNEETKEVKFSADFPLKIGNNNVLVVASETNDLAARKFLVIHRRAAELAAKPPAADKPTQ